MTVTEQLHSLGDWSVTLADDTPRAVTDQLGFFGHVAIWRGRVDVEETADADLLTSARYVGVLREKPAGRISLNGSGMIYWLGDEDGKGAVLESPVTFNADTLTHCVTTLLPPAVTVGTIHDPGGTYSGTHQWQTPRAVLDTICTAFGVEYRVNGNGTVDVGTAADLYGTTASTIISARGAGVDFDITSLGAEFATDTAVIDYSTRVVVLGQKIDSAGASTSFAEGSADAASFPYKDLFGNPVHVTRTVADAGQTDASAPAAALLQLNLYNRTKRALTIRADDYDTSGQAVVGQNAYVFDPENGLLDPGTQIDFRGELIFPQLIRISALQWSITDGHTVAFRTQDGAWVDLTRWVVWDPGSDQITVGDLPRTLTSASNPVLDQTNSAPDSSVPNPPTGLALTTTSVESSVGQPTATISASWTAPATNTDGSVVTDLSHYLVQYRWQGRAPLWDTRLAPTETIDIPGLSVGLVYDVEVAAVDTTGHVSAWTAVASITAAPDQSAPNPPSDPAVTSYLGQLRIAWDGKDNTGAGMPPDFAIVEVHVSATSGFTPDSSPGSATLVSELSTAGVAYATAPYGAARYVKLVAVDNSLNRSAPSGQVTGSTVQVADGDIASLNVGKLTAGTMSADVVMAGRFATALTGARVEVNSLGVQGFQSDGVTKWLSLTATESLLTGTYKTALSGRRIEMGAGGALGEIDFYAPDGTKTLVRAFTEPNTGVESIQMAVPIGANAGASYDFLWNRIHLNSDEWAQFRANKLDLYFGTSGAYILRMTPDRGETIVNRLQVDSSAYSYWDAAGVERFKIDAATMLLWDANGKGRIGFDGSSMTLWDQSGNVRVSITSGASVLYDGTGSTTARLTINNGSDVWWQWGGVASRMLLRPGSFPGCSTRVQLMNDFNYGVVLRNVSASDGSASRLDVMDANESVYERISAAGFDVSSAAAGKTGIGDWSGDAMAVLGRARPRTYRRRHGRGSTLHGEPTGRAPRGAKEIGLVAEEAPAELLGQDGQRIDLYAMTTLAVAALQQIHGRLAALEGAK